MWLLHCTILYIIYNLCALLRNHGKALGWRNMWSNHTNRVLYFCKRALGKMTDGLRLLCMLHSDDRARELSEEHRWGECCRLRQWILAVTSTRSELCCWRDTPVSPRARENRRRALGGHTPISGTGLSLCLLLTWPRTSLHSVWALVMQKGRRQLDWFHVAQTHELGSLYWPEAHRVGMSEGGLRRMYRAIV